MEPNILTFEEAILCVVIMVGAAIVCGSSSFSAAAEAGEITTVDAVVETAVDVIPADAESFKGQTFPEQGTSV